MQDEFIGRQIGDFIIKDRIGRGGMALVYRAHQPSVNRDVALKIIRLDQENTDEHFKERFAKEAAVVASLEHIHILPIYNYGIQDNIAYLAMRLLRGGTLRDLLAEGPLPLEQVENLFNQLAKALSYAHSKGVIHRDLKPSNIMFDDSGDVFLADFGLAKIIEGDPDLTRSGNVVGTPTYMSPEQLRGEVVDYRSDVYSLGVVLYHMLTGRAPFESSKHDIVSIIYKQLEEKPQLPSKLNPVVPPNVEQVILTALEKDRDDRYNSVAEMLEAFNYAVGRTSSHSSTLMRRPISRARARARRRRLAAGGTVAVVVLALLVLVLFLLPGLTRAPGDNGTPTADEQPAILPMPTVMPGDKVLGGAIVPDEKTIKNAQQRMGDQPIYYFACTQDSEYHATLAREIRQFAASYDLSLVLRNGEGDRYIQLTQIEAALGEGIRAMIVCPLDTTLLDPTLQAAQQDGVFLVQFAAENSYGGVRLAGDDFGLGQKIGRTAGQYIMEHLGGEANIIILDFSSLPAIVQRADGLEAGVREIAPDVNIIGRYIGGTRDNGEQSVTQLLSEGVEFNVILSINDAGSFGAIAALEDAGIPPGEVFIFSVDAERLAQRYIRDGYYMVASVAIDRQLSARASVDALINLLGGATIAEQVLTPPGNVVTRETLLAQDAAATPPVPPD